MNKYANYVFKVWRVYRFPKCALKFFRLCLFYFFIGTFILHYMYEPSCMPQCFSINSLIQIHTQVNIDLDLLKSGCLIGCMASWWFEPSEKCPWRSKAIRITAGKIKWKKSLLIHASHCLLYLVNSWLWWIYQKWFIFLSCFTLHLNIYYCMLGC